MNIKRKISVLAVLVVAAFGSVALGAPVAGAASCTAGTSHITWTGQYSYDAILSSCTGVDGAEMGDGTGTHNGYIWDASVGAAHAASSGGGTTTGFFSIYWTTYKVSNWGLSCNGQSSLHSVSSYFSYRIHNATGVGSWGSWHQYGGIRYELLC